MVGWHHPLDRREFEQAPGVGDGQGGLACCSPWGREESDTTERLNRTELKLVGGASQVTQWKEFGCSAGDAGSVTGWGRSPGEGLGNPFQYSCLENAVDRGV